MACSKEQLEVHDGHLCPICSETYNIPRSLPTCGHTFCENCLFTFVLNLKENGKLGETFDCPVCEMPHPVPNEGGVTLEWIQTFPRMTDFAGTDKGSCEVASDETEEVTNCGTCAKVSVVAPSEKYCLDCQTYLCGVCAEAHIKFDALANHKFIESRQFLEVKDTITDLFKYRKCPSHPGRDVELFCKDDEVFLCLICASTSHKNCRNDIEASQCAQDTDRKLSELKTRVRETQKHLAILRVLARQNSNLVSAKTASAEKDVTDIRNKIVGHLDTIVENVFKSTKQIRKEAEDKCSATERNIERLNGLFDNKLVYLSNIGKYGSTAETYIGSDLLTLDIEKLEEEVIELDTMFETADVDLAIVDELNKLSERTNPGTMPTIMISCRTSEHKPKYSPPHDAAAKFELVDVEKHSVRFEERRTPTFIGISMKDDGRLILSDSYCNNLCIYNPDKKSKKTLQSCPHKATSLKNKSIGFTWHSTKKISIVTVGPEIKMEKTMDTQYQPASIRSLSDGNVAISWRDPPGFSIADISGTSVQESQYLTQDSDGRTFKSFDYMAIDEPRQLVIQPCTEDKAVFCFDFTGKPVFKYTNGLKYPQGVSVDSRGGSVFVCDSSGDCIHQLSVRGQPMTVIRHADLKEPEDVCYDKKRRCIWITNSNYLTYEVIFCLKRA